MAGVLGLRLSVLLALGIASVLAIHPERARAQGAIAPARSASDAVQRFVALNAKSALMTPAGQMVNRVAAVPTLGELSAPDRIESPLAGYAVARVMARGPNGQPTNGYLVAYKDSQGSWAVLEARGLYRAFEAKAESPNMHFSEKRLEQKYLHQAEIAMKTDSDLAQWFEARRAQFDKLRALINTGPYGALSWGPEKPPRTDDYNLVLYNLGADIVGIVVTRGDLLVRVFQHDEEMLGFHYSPAAPPRMDPDSNLWREALGDDWYLIRRIPKCPWPADRFNCRKR